MDTALGQALKRYRLEEARKLDKPAFHVFTNKQLELMVDRPPRSTSELLAVPGFGPKKLEMYAASAKASWYAGVNSSFLLKELSPSASAGACRAPPPRAARPQQTASRRRGRPGS